MINFAHSFRPLNIFIQIIGINHFKFPWNSPKNKVHLKSDFLFIHLILSNFLLISTTIFQYFESESFIDKFLIYFICLNLFIYNFHRIKEIRCRNYIWSAIKELNEVDVMVKYQNYLHFSQLLFEFFISDNEFW